MRLTMGDVIARLRTEGAVTQGEADAMRATAATPAADEMPWYLRVAVGLGAWAATGFLLAFLFVNNAIDEDRVRIVAGTALLAAAVWARRTSDAEFVRHAAVAASLAAQGLIIVTVGSLTGSGASAGGIGVALSVLLIPLVPDPVHRFLSVLVGVASAAVVATDLEWAAGLDMVMLGVALLAAWAWRGEPRGRSLSLTRILEPVGYGLVVAAFGLLLLDSAMDGRPRFVRESMSGLGVVTAVVFTMLLLALAVAILREQGATLGGRAAVMTLVAVTLLGVATWTSPGIVAGVAALVLGFDRRNPVLVGMASIFLLVFGSVYYYSLGLTLLEKGGVLVASGLLLLGLRTMIVGRPAAKAGR